MLKKRRRSHSAPSLRPRRSPLSDHYRFDIEKRHVLPGVPTHEDDWARDAHDFYNLIMLIPVSVVNGMNWNWDMLLYPNSKSSLEDAFTGEWIDAFFIVTMIYFLIDFVWILLCPSCVKSPGTIIMHHVAVFLAFLVPIFYSQYQWISGACMSVEINTWFLIARRVFNKKGFPPWIVKLPFMLSIRIKFISISFYFTWILFRCILYPYILCVMAKLLHETKHEPLIISFSLHLIFCCLNLKWSYDLLTSKIRYWRRGGKAGQSKFL